MQATLIEDFLNPDFTNTVEEILGSKDFPWFWRSSTTYGEADLGADHKDFQFIHIMYFDNAPKSNVFGLAQEILFAFEQKTGKRIKEPFRIKANLTVQSNLTDDELKSAIHIDTPKGSNTVSILYYVNDSDGDTVFYDDDKNEIQRFSPKKGTAVWFPSDNWHRHTPPRDNKRRLVINFVVQLEE